MVMPHIVNPRSLAVVFKSTLFLTTFFRVLLPWVRVEVPNFMSMKEPFSRPYRRFSRVTFHFWLPSIFLAP